MQHRCTLADDAVDDAVDATLAAWLAAPFAAGSDAAGEARPQLAVALSGGRDSMVVLHALANSPRRSSFRLCAVHVHHGLSPCADRWAEFCAAECDARAIPLATLRVAVIRHGGESLEATARNARYSALRAAGVDAVALGHHADDQAETVLLQLLRGAGPTGLAAMPVRADGSAPVLLRPLLSVGRDTLTAYALRHELGWIEDESNVETQLRRNLLRRVVVPHLRAAFPGYPRTLVRAAAHQAEAAALLDTLAQIDGNAIARDDSQLGLALDRAALATLAAADAPRARNLLRWFLRHHGLPAPSAARLGTMLAQCTQARPDARVRLCHAGSELGVHRGCIAVHCPADSRPFAIAWQGESAVALPGGVLEFRAVVGSGLAAAMLEGRGVVLRSRAGGERLRLGPRRPRQAVATLLQTHGAPWWQRNAWPLLWCGDTLAAVPGVGVDVAFTAANGAKGFELCWRPHPRHERDSIPVL